MTERARRYTKITKENLSNPNGVAVDKDDNIYVSDWGNSSILKFTKEGKLMKVVGRKGTQPGEFSELSLIKVIDDKLYVCDRGNYRFQILNTELEYVDSLVAMVMEMVSLTGQLILLRMEQEICM